MEFKDMHQSRLVKGIIVGLLIFAAALLIFQAGMYVGYRRAGFSSKFGDNYLRNFGPRKGRGFMNPDFPNGHGAVGKIISISLPTLVVEGPDNLEKIIVLDDNTEIRQFRDNGTQNDLKVDQYVVVLGSPNNQGQILAKLIRVIPSPPNMSNSGASFGTSTSSSTPR